MLVERRRLKHWYQQVAEAREAAKQPAPKPPRGRRGTPKSFDTIFQTPAKKRAS